jgi:hypothetical protein
MTQYKEWISYNAETLEELYYHLIKISYNNGIELIDSEDCFKNFLLMMFHESNKSYVIK